jgi:2'-5' RNA ligase
VRLFIGLSPGAPAVAHLAAAIDRLGDTGFQRTAPDNWHLTLAFLGEVADRRLPDIADAATDAARGIAPFPLRLSGAQILGRRSPVLCTDVDGDLAALRDLVARLRDCLTRHRVPFDPRPFLPHLTVGRAPHGAPAASLADSADALSTLHGPPWTVAAIRLYQTQPGPPVTYKTAAGFPLAP